MTTVARWLACVVMLVALGGCGQGRGGVAVFYPPGELPQPPGSGPVAMTYLGNGGWIIRYSDATGDAVILTAPFFSNPRGARVYLPGGADPARIEQRLAGIDLSRVETVLIGHAHYDHAMDLPYIFERRLPRTAKLYGSTTVRNLLAHRLGDTRIVDVTPGEGRRGPWITPGDGAVRFMPLWSQHAPHVLGFVKVVWWGRLGEMQTSLPWTPAGWPEGETLAYLIDFVRAGKVVFRVYYQDSAAPPGFGVPDLSDGVNVNVAILCVAGFDQVDNSPTAILEVVKPHVVVGGHWEDFFGPFVGELPQVAAGSSLEKFVRRAHRAAGAPVFVPAPGQTLSFPLQAR